MDSCVCTAIASRDYDVALLHVNYGQRTESRELRAFNDIASFYSVPENRRLVVSIEHLLRIGGSSLTDPGMEIGDANPDAAGIPDTYVPFRNANMMSIGVSWAEVLGAEALYIGAVEEDSSGYPDCRRAFYSAYQQVIETGTRYEVPLQVKTPLIELDKAGIVRLGIDLSAPLHLSWSCYRNEILACGSCESCVLRLKGFNEAGHDDPIPYEETQRV